MFDFFISFSMVWPVQYRLLRTQFLLQIYVRIHKESARHPHTVQADALHTFRKMEEGDSYQWFTYYIFVTYFVWVIYLLLKKESLKLMAKWVCFIQWLFLAHLSTSPEHEVLSELLWSFNVRRPSSVVRASVRACVRQQFL